MHFSIQMNLLNSLFAEFFWLALLFRGYPIGFHHPLDGITNPEHQLLHFIQLNNFFAKRRRRLLLTGIGAAT
jgi:hypothetical protein